MFCFRTDTERKYSAVFCFRISTKLFCSIAFCLWTFSDRLIKSIECSRQFVDLFYSWMQRTELPEERLLETIIILLLKKVMLLDWTLLDGTDDDQ